MNSSLSGCATHVNHIGLTSGIHNHDYHQLLFGIRGETGCTFSQTENIINITRCCIVPAGERHSYEGLVQQSDILVLNIAANGKLAVLVDSLAKDRVLNKIFDRSKFLQVDERLTGMVQSAAQQLSCQTQNPFSQVHLVTGLLSEIYRFFEPGDAIQYCQNKISVQQLNWLIDQNLRRPLGVGELAKKLCVSESHFYALCQQAFRLTPHQYALQRRLTWAQNLLRDSAMNISNVAYEAGFSSPGAFSRAFKKQFGCTPRHYQYTQSTKYIKASH